MSSAESAPRALRHHPGEQQVVVSRVAIQAVVAGLPSGRPATALVVARRRHRAEGYRWPEMTTTGHAA